MIYFSIGTFLGKVVFSCKEEEDSFRDLDLLFRFRDLDMLFLNIFLLEEDFEDFGAEKDFWILNLFLLEEDFEDFGTEKDFSDLNYI